MTPRLIVLAASRGSKVACRDAAVRGLSSSARCMVNPLLNLSHFSASKEAQFFSKERRIPREEFLPHIQLIRSSEVDPFAPTPGATPSVVSALKRAEKGHTDVETAYSLAIQNLGQQLVLSRRDVAEARALLASVHDKYRRDERNSFILIMATVTFISFIAVNTNMIAELRDYARGVKSEWKGFDWEWLGNPPSYKAQVDQANGVMGLLACTSGPFTKSTSYSDAYWPVERQYQSDRLSRDEMVSPSLTPSTRQPSHRFVATQSPPSTNLADRWTWSRLFWASPQDPKSV